MSFDVAGPKGSSTLTLCLLMAYLLLVLSIFRMCRELLFHYTYVVFTIYIYNYNALEIWSYIVEVTLGLLS